MTEKKQSSLKEEQKKLKDLEKLKRERDQYLADWQKARAELINYKKEEEKRLQQVIRFANERIIKELIAILDNFDLALQSIQNSFNRDKKEEKFIKGLVLIKSQIEDLLKKEGVAEIPAAKGEKPDIKYQEIVSEVVTSEVPEGTIAEIFQKGYTFNGKVIRPVRVAIAKSEKKNNRNIPIIHACDKRCSGQRS